MRNRKTTRSLLQSTSHPGLFLARPACQRCAWAVCALLLAVGPLVRCACGPLARRLGCAACWTGMPLAAGPSVPSPPPGAAYPSAWSVLALGPGRVGWLGRFEPKDLCSSFRCFVNFNKRLNTSKLIIKCRKIIKMPNQFW